MVTTLNFLLDKKHLKIGTIGATKYDNIISDIYQHCVLYHVFIIMDVEWRRPLDRDEALHCVMYLTTYFGQFNRIDQYMRDQKWHK